jgi:hypothetical protein
MGHKTVKEHYDIGHIVAVYNKMDFGGPCICIGSPYIHDIIVIRISDAKVVKEYGKRDYSANKDLARYNEALKQDEQTGKLRELIDAPDTFAASLPVYTISRWVVVEKQCEAYGWPNTTHAGEIMYENTYFKTRKEAYAYLLRDTTNGLRYSNFTEHVSEGYKRIKRAFGRGIRDIWYWVAARTLGRFIMK